MIPIYQTSFHPEGNCLSAAIASITHIPLDEVPLFIGDDNWFARVIEWLESRGYSLDLTDNAPDGWAICTGRSPRGDFHHAVVSYKDRIIHDPHPDGTGLIGDYRKYWILNKA